MLEGSKCEYGHKYEIAKVTDIRRVAGLKAGGVDIRYACKLDNKEVYMFLEEDRWFMERRNNSLSLVMRIVRLV